VNEHRLPEDVHLARTSPLWTESTVPAGLLSAHRIAEGVWGRLVVSAGKLTLIFEDTPDETHVLATGDSAVIPPARPHHVVLDGPVEFSIEFHRRP
jgi:tellurite resistance-related uncharacterized protein